jgi:hypothetical protein
MSRPKPKPAVLVREHSAIKGTSQLVYSSIQSRETLNTVNRSVPDLVKVDLKLKGSTCRLLACHEVISPYGVSTNLKCPD